MQLIAEVVRNRRMRCAILVLCVLAGIAYCSAAVAQDAIVEDPEKKAEERRKADSERFDSFGPTLGGIHQDTPADHHGMSGYSAGGGVFAKPHTSVSIAAGGRWLALDYALRYAGASLWETTQWTDTVNGLNHEDTPAPSGYLAATTQVASYTPTRSAWMTLPIYMLQAFALDQSFFGCIANDPSGTSCATSYLAAVKHILRFKLMTPDGEEHELRQVEFDPPLTNEDWQCDEALETQLEEGKTWRTHDGSQLELSFAGDNAFVTMPGGTRVVFPWTRQTNVQMPGCSNDATTYPVYRAMAGNFAPVSGIIDRNGNQVTYAYDVPVGFTYGSPGLGATSGNITITDPLGSQINVHWVEHDVTFATPPSNCGLDDNKPCPAAVPWAQPHADAITVSGPNGQPLRYAVQWSRRFYDASAILGPNWIETDQKSSQFWYWVVDAIVMPDGRTHGFQYSNLGTASDGTTISDGLLVGETMPSGSTVTYAYVDPSAALTPACNYPSCSNCPTQLSCDPCGTTLCQACSSSYPCLTSGTTCFSATACPDPYIFQFPAEFGSGALQKMNGKRLTSRTTTDGLGHSMTESYGATADFANTVLVTTTTLDDRIEEIEMLTDSHFMSNGLSVAGTAGKVSRKTTRMKNADGSPGAVLHQEVFSGWQWEPGLLPSGITNLAEAWNVRWTTRTITQDGVSWTETVAYDASAGTLGPGAGIPQTRGMVVQSTLTAGNGAVLRTDSRDYVTDPAYAARGLWSLPKDESVIDAKYGTLSQTSYAYDEAVPASSGRPGLDASMGNVRGNPTTVSQSELVGQNRTIQTHTTYFDTGAVQSTQDPRGNVTHYTIDARTCTASPTLQSSVTNPLGQTSATVVDCATGATLSVTDANGAQSCTQVDDLGRVVEAAGPGEQLTAQPGFVRDPACPVVAGRVGANGNGPGSWIDYPPRGVNGPQNTVTHSRDGTSDGHYVKTYLDGLGRTVQTCTEACSDVDTSLTCTESEACTFAVYDAIGRVAQEYSTYFAGQTTGPSLGGSAQYVSKQYDALGRITRVGLSLAGSDVTSDDGNANVSTYVYAAAGSNLQVTETNPRGFQTITTSDPQGHPVMVQRQGCSSGLCTTSSTYDALGRLRSLTDPAGNVATMAYDGLGHKISMNDPDLGPSTYAYDASGNLIQESDAKNQVSSMQYDPLDRLLLKDVPPAGPGPEDLVNTYDGTLPTCGCDGTPGEVCCDPAAADACDPVTVTCLHAPSSAGAGGDQADAGGGPSVGAGQGGAGADAGAGAGPVGSEADSGGPPSSAGDGSASTTAAPPQISGMQQAFAPFASTVESSDVLSILGSGFSAPGLAVTLGGVSITSGPNWAVSDSQITVDVPSTLSTGTYPVSVGNAAGTSTASLSVQGCDATVPCSASFTIGGVSGQTCRNVDSRGWAWLTPAQAASLCSDTSQTCANNAQCAGTVTWCANICPVGSGVGWVATTACSPGACY